MSATDRRLLDARLQLPQGDAKKWALIFGLIGVVCLGFTALGFFNEAERADALASYLVAFMFGATIVVGGLFFAILQHLVGARWSTTLRRIAENLGSLTPIYVILFLPIALHIKDLYPCASGGVLPEEVAAKAAYLNPGFFKIRAAFYLLVWAVMGTVFYRRSVAMDQTGDPLTLKRLRFLSAPSILLFGTTLTFAGFDWLMSLDPTWYSTMFGVYTFAGTVISSLATIAMTTILLQRAGYARGVINLENFHDLGKLMFGFVVFWAYIAFSQYMLIWYANLPEETAWYLEHWENGYSTPAVMLCLFHFALPFFAILSRHAKRNMAIMLPISILLIGMHYVDLFWVVMPLKRHAFHVSVRDLTALFGIIGVTVAGYFIRLGAASMVAVKDPYVQAAMEYDNV